MRCSIPGRSCSFGWRRLIRATFSARGVNTSTGITFARWRNTHCELRPIMTHLPSFAAPSTWTDVTVTGAPSGQGVTGLAIDPKDSATVVVMYAGFSDTADPPQHAFLTTNKGVGIGAISAEWRGAGTRTCRICR